MTQVAVTEIVGQEVYVGGQPFTVLSVNEDGSVIIARPKGLKDYRAVMLDPSMDHLYGARRYKIIPPVVG